MLTAFLESYKSAAGKLIGLRDDRLVSRKKRKVDSVSTPEFLPEQVSR